MKPTKNTLKNGITRAIARMKGQLAFQRKEIDEQRALHREEKSNWINNKTRDVYGSMVYHEGRIRELKAAVFLSLDNITMLEELI